ncbi:glutathione S-transferase [Acrasis kona]|uniref:Glutathione S-transferase n=1 Tax=Acrasis kona TaxID=1008807 RepID=A0AAW2ZIL1_9EUKA
MNPNMKIPVLNDDGFVLFESVAIAKYLHQKHENTINDQWFPKEIKQRALINSYLDWHHNHFRPRIATCAFAVIGPMLFKTKPLTDDKVQETKRAAFKAIKDLEEQWLKDGKFIAGQNAPSLADLFAYGELIQLSFVFGNKEIQLGSSAALNDYPKVKKWCSKMEELPHYGEVHNFLSKFIFKTFSQQSKL